MDTTQPVFRILKLLVVELYRSLVDFLLVPNQCDPQAFPLRINNETKGIVKLPEKPSEVPSHDALNCLLHIEGEVLGQAKMTFTPKHFKSYGVKFALMIHLLTLIYTLKYEIKRNIH